MKLINASRARWISIRRNLHFSQNEMPETESDCECRELSDDDKDAQLLSNSRVPSIHGRTDPFSNVHFILQLLRGAVELFSNPSEAYALTN